MNATIRLALAGLVVTALSAACSSGSGDGSGGSRATTSAGEGFAIGEIKRLPGGTAVPADARTLVSAVCNDGRLVLRTDRESVVGQMDCDRMIPPEVVERFRGKPVALSYRGERLRIESASEGTVELSVNNATVGSGDVSP